LAWWGAVLCTLSALLFGVLHIPDLPAHFQWDGQLAEYLAWTQAPDQFQGTINAELNPRLYSVYYPLLAQLHRYTDRITLLTSMYVGELMLLGWATFACGWWLVRDAWAASLLSTAVIWGDALATTLGGGGGVGLVCNPEYSATAMILVGLGLSMRGHHRWAILCAAGAFNVHGSLAIFGSVMVFAAATLDLGKRRGWARLAQVTLLGFLAAGPTAYWALSDMPTGGEAWAAQTWWQFPHWVYSLHIYVSTSPWQLWLGFAGLVIPGLVGWHAIRNEFTERQHILLGWSLAAVLLLALGYVFVEWYPVRFVAQLTLWRGTRFVLIVALAFGLHWLVRQSKAGGPIALLVPFSLLSLIGIPVAHLATIGWAALALMVMTTWRGRSTVGKILILAAFAILMGLAWSNFEHGHISSGFALRLATVVFAVAIVWIWAARAERSLRFASASVAIVMLFCFLHAWNLGGRLGADKFRKARALAALAPAIRQHSQPGELVVAPPTLRNPGAWADRGSFLCRQQLTAYAYFPWLIPELIERMHCIDPDVDEGLTVYSLTALAEKYAAADRTVFENLHARYGVRLAIIDRARPLPYRRVAMNEAFSVYDLAVAE